MAINPWDQAEAERKAAEIVAVVQEALALAIRERRAVVFECRATGDCLRKPGWYLTVDIVEGSELA